MISIQSTYGTQEFSSAMRDLLMTISYDRAVVQVQVTKDGESTTIYNETLFPDSSNIICLSDIDYLLEPYAEKWLVFSVTFTITEQQVTEDADGNEVISATTTESLSVQIVSCSAQMPNETAQQFCSTHFLTLLEGVRQTAPGWLEYLTYTGTTAAACHATYSDGSEAVFTPECITGNDDFSVIDASPRNFTVTGKVLLSYYITVGDRRQDYELLQYLDVDVAPVLLFMNSFGVEELAYCTGAHQQVASFDRKQARIGRLKKSYEVQEKESFKADTGPLSYPMANWWREVLRSKDVKVLPVSQGEVEPAQGIPVVITAEKAELSNEADALPRYTFEYEYSDRNHNYFLSRVEGRIFDNTFDNTFN